ncbi:MAG: hypothetical protein HC915_13975 [Anaerolineae bacterium]|nr:hypothetical protein [Anaerolineae bacterium]
MRAAELYARSIHWWDEAYDYFIRTYAQLANKALIFTEIDEEVVGCLLISFGNCQHIAQHIVTGMANTAEADTSFRAGRFRDPFFQEIYARVLAACRREQVVEIAELFFLDKAEVKAKLETRQAATWRDLHALSMQSTMAWSEDLTDDALRRLRASFASSRHDDPAELLHDTYRLVTLATLISGFTEGKKRLDPDRPATSLQWTTSDIHMYKVFKRACDHQTRRRWRACSTGPCLTSCGGAHLCSTT